MNQIKLSRSKHIIPFQFSDEFNDQIAFLRESNLFINTNDAFLGGYRVHPYILKNFSQDSNIYQEFSLIPSKITKCFLDENQRRKSSFYISKNKDACYNFSIEKITLHLFSSKVGFLVIHYDLNVDTINHYIEANYILKMFKANKVNEIEKQTKVNKDEYVVETVSLKQDLENILGLFNISHSFDNKPKSNDIVPTEVLVYNSIFTTNDTNLESMKKYVSMLSLGHKSSYKISATAIEEVIHNRYDNVIWGTSLEGVCCGAFEVDDVTTNQTITQIVGKGNGSSDRVYFYLYLLVLNQRFALTSLIGSIEEHMEFKISSKELKRIKQNIMVVKYQISEVALTTIFNDISVNSNYQNLYNELRKTLNIESLIQELEIKSGGLDDRIELISLERDRNKDVLTTLIATTAPLWAILMFLHDFIEYIYFVLEEHNINYQNMYVSTTVSIIVFTLLIFYYILLAVVYTRKPKLENKYLKRMVRERDGEK